MDALKNAVMDCYCLALRGRGLYFQLRLLKQHQHRNPLAYCHADGILATTIRESNHEEGAKQR